MFDGTKVDVKFEGNWLVLSKNFCLMAEKQRFHFLKWQNSLKAELIHFENCQDVPISHEQEQVDEHFYNS